MKTIFGSNSSTMCTRWNKKRQMQSFVKTSLGHQSSGKLKNKKNQQYSNLVHQVRITYGPGVIYMAESFVWQLKQCRAKVYKASLISVIKYSENANLHRLSNTVLYIIPDMDLYMERRLLFYLYQCQIQFYASQLSSWQTFGIVENKKKSLNSYS